ncbi:MAG: hypothetical protein DI529_10470 [Chryseobacterium sp.]|nr:MAG: hypothetical protein DI529_10470 [Chryseobacterium sp.]
MITYTVNYIDLGVTKVVSNATPLAGDVVTFTITATNYNTTLAASNVNVQDLLPTGYTFISANQAAYNQSTGTWNIGSLAASSSITLTINAMVNDTGVYNNTASISSLSYPDNVNTNDSATATVTVCKGGSTAPQIRQ